MQKKVFIVAVNYNGMIYFEDFFQSVLKQVYNNIEVVMVDNNSTDKSVEWIKNSQYPVWLINSNENRGFGEGANIGIDYAISKGAEYILLLNIDTILDSNLVGELVKYANENTVTTAVIYCGDKEERRLWYAGGLIDYDTANVKQLLYEEDLSEDEKEVSFISGCCMLIHRSIFDKVGYFDKNFYLYYEDADFCVRLSKNNIIMKCITTSSLWHKVGGSSIGGNEMSYGTQYYVVRNRLLFANKYPELFKNGNLKVLQEILRERNFFAGRNNEKYELYVKAAVKDYMKEYYECGYYGRSLLEEYFYMENGFYERETDGEKYWYCAADVQADIYIVNSKKNLVEYEISFDVAKPVYDIDEYILIELDSQEVGKYRLSSDVNHVELVTLVPIEGKKKLHFKLCGEDIKFIERSDGGIVFYQLLNLNVKELVTSHLERE